MRCNLRYIDYSSADERATIGDPHHCRMPVFLIVDADQCPETGVTDAQQFDRLRWCPVRSPFLRSGLNRPMQDRTRLAFHQPRAQVPKE